MKKLLSLLLILALCLSLFPAAALADAPEDEETRAAEGGGPYTEETNEPAPAEDPADGDGGEDTSSGVDAPPSPQGEGNDDPDEPVGADALGGQSDDPDALPPAADEPQMLGSGECGDDLVWVLSDSGVLTIAGTGDMWDWGPLEAPWYERCDRITSLRVTSGVTGIGDYAFCDCWNMTAVTLPEGVTRIGFAAFSNCGGLTSLTLPEGVTGIGDYAFEGCSNMTGVTIPASVTAIGDSVFSYCDRLTDIYYGGTKAAWQELAAGYDHNAITVHCSDGDFAPADATACGYDLTWTLDSEGVLTIAGTGEMWDFDQTNPAPWYSRREEIRSVRLLSGVTGVGDFAFLECSNMTDVTLPEGLARIGGCAFLGSDSLASVTIPASVTVIGSSAFAYYQGPKAVRSLTEIRFEGSAPTIGEYCFHNISVTAYYPRLDPSWTAAVRQNYGGTVTWVAYGPLAAGECGDNLTWVLDEDGTLTISGAGDMWDWDWDELPPWYERCDQITSLRVTSGVTGIGNYAFLDCWNITDVTLPEGVTRIGFAAFNGCGSLTGLMLPASVTAIGASVFSSCESLTDIYFGGTMAAWKQLAAGYDHYSVTVHCSDGDFAPADATACGYDLTWTLDSEGVLTISGAGEMWDFEWTSPAPWYSRREEIRSVRLLSGVTGVGDYAFEGCSNMTGVTLPEGVTRIGDAAFSWCWSLNSVTIPEGVISIGDRTFESCWNMTDVTIPEGVTSIGDSAFQGCESLASVTIPASVISIGRLAFAYIQGSEIRSVTEIRFQGRAPMIGDNCFYETTATARYPQPDPTWTEEVRQDYGGTITWVAYQLPGIPVNASRFPDPIFRAYVAEHFDSDGDGYLSEEEIALAKVIDLEESGVASLKGIEYLTELEELNASGGFMTAGQLTSVDLSANTKLKTLSLGFNPLEGLDLSMLPALESLNVGFCGLSELDLSGSPALRELWCDDNNLTELDLSCTPGLTHLDCCGNTGLLELDITPCPSLVADYQAGGRHISWMQEGMPEQYESIWVYGGTNDDDYNLAVNDYMTIIAPSTHTPGDINGDGKVNNKDVTRLARYLKGDAVEVVEAALDVNGDGKVNNKDLTRLQRYLKSGDVEIH